jgi:hypothetical protein
MCRWNARRRTSALANPADWATAWSDGVERRRARFEQGAGVLDPERFDVCRGRLPDLASERARE